VRRLFISSDSGDNLFTPISPPNPFPAFTTWNCSQLRDDPGRSLSRFGEEQWSHAEEQLLSRAFSCCRACSGRLSEGFTRAKRDTPRHTPLWHTVATWIQTLQLHKLEHVLVPGRRGHSERSASTTPKAPSPHSRARRSEGGTEARATCCSVLWMDFTKQPYCSRLQMHSRFHCRGCAPPLEVLDLLQLCTTSLPAPAPDDYHQHSPGQARYLLH
jgi:hypothetical protein